LSRQFFSDRFDRHSRWEIFETVLLALVLLDLALGGNGYLVKIGPLRVREVLFAVCAVWVVLRLLWIVPVRLDPTLIKISVLFIAVTAFGAVYGYLEGSTPAALAAELKPLSYYGMLPFFLVAIRTRRSLTLTAGILVVCGLLLASLYLLALTGSAAGLVSDQTMIELLRRSDEFIIRRGPHDEYLGFLYKGTFYICLAVFFLALDPFRSSKIIAALPVVSIAMTLTRGLCLAVAASLLAGMTLQRSWPRVMVLFLLSALMIGALLLAQRTEHGLPAMAAPPTGQTVGQAAGAPPKPQESLAQEILRPTDNLRVDDMKFVMHELDWRMLLIGRGLGAPIRGRDRIELNYFEILYKQGILGLSVWIALLLYMLRLFRAVPPETKAFGSAFLLSGLFVYAATATNTFLTGSIGMAVVFISLAALLVLSREPRRPMEPSDWYGVRLGGWLGNVAAMRRASQGMP
jgi:hypothetical protein